MPEHLPGAQLRGRALPVGVPQPVALLPVSALQLPFLANGSMRCFRQNKQPELRYSKENLQVFFFLTRRAQVHTTEQGIVLGSHAAAGIFMCHV
jgi:hypothetical protein